MNTTTGNRGQRTESSCEHLSKKAIALFCMDFLLPPTVSDTLFPEASVELAKIGTILAEAREEREDSQLR